MLVGYDVSNILPQAILIFMAFRCVSLFAVIHFAVLK
jgi:hypothetical protein